MTPDEAATWVRQFFDEVRDSTTTDTMERLRLIVAFHEAVDAEFRPFFEETLYRLRREGYLSREIAEAAHTYRHKVETITGVYAKRHGLASVARPSYPDLGDAVRQVPNSSR